MKEELVKCPKCNGEAEVIGHYIKGVANRYHYFVRCKECKHRRHNEYKKKEKAINNWNNQNVNREPRG